jgi:hypothetical protein
MSSEQKCIYCQQVKSLSDFPPHSRYRHCIKEHTSIRKKLKLSAPDKPTVCECCGKIPKIHPKTGKPTWCLDHNHTNNEFRGWVCDRCNSGIGKLGDNIEGLVKALNYLLSRNK